MKPIVAATYLSILLVVPAVSVAKHGTTDAAMLAACPTEGDAKLPQVKALNVLKRRMTTPAPADIDAKVTMKAMLAPGEDANRFDTNEGATISGFVVDVIPGGVESVNCHTHDKKYRDTHIELTLDPLHDAEMKHVIVEVTPQWRKAMAAKGMDWGTSTLHTKLKGRWVKFTGWLFYDEEHTNAAENTHPGGAHNWRATVWEIHPITDIQVLASKPHE